MTIARLRRHLHWWTAALLSLGFVIAWAMTNLPASELLVKFLLYQVHKSFGLIVFGLAALRLALAWAVGDGPRGPVAVLYGLLLTVPVLGFLAAASSPVEVPTWFLMLWPVPHPIGPDPAVFDVVRPVHRWLAVALIVLAAAHAIRMGRR